MNAGTELGQLSGCFVLLVEDDIDSIMNAVHQAVKIHKSGGGTGFDFSRLRPKNDPVGSTGGIASGPISFMRIFDTATEVIKQGGKRRGANMGILRVDHPDIASFITVKRKEGRLKNFNLSVGITKEFMEALESDKDYDLINPHTKRPINSVNAHSTFILLCALSWSNGEPAVIFLDTINKYNPTPNEPLEATNPCGETPYESCNLGSINLSKFIKKNGRVKVDYEKLKKTIRLTVKFLDNVIDANKYPLPQIREKTLQNRKIGLGIMGWADLLVLLGIKYDSEEAIQLAKDIMKFIRDEGMQMSRELAKERGNFPNKGNSIYKDEPFMRNATITTIAPTGTISKIAECSYGIEPYFALIVKRNVKETLGKNLFEIAPAIKKIMQTKGLWNEEYNKALESGSCIVLPKEIKDLAQTTMQINPEWQVRMQAAFQEYTHNAVSKTVNLPKSATSKDIAKIYRLAYKLGCKGITVYRDGSRDNQLLEANDGQCTTCPS
jgi:ribonucleoside-diphosphate reductase alpha chain